MKKNSRISQRYSPCPLEVTKILSTLVSPSSHPGVLLDNCAGDGLNASILAANWNLKPFLVEPNKPRATICSTRKNAKVICGKAEQVVMVPCPSVWFFNPPFKPSDKLGNMEKDIFISSLKYAIKPRTLGILLLPIRSILNTNLANLVIQHFCHLKARTFPEPYLSDYSQMVLFGYGRQKPLGLKEGKPGLLRYLRNVAKNPSNFSLTNYEFSYSVYARIEDPKVLLWKNFYQDI